MPKKLPRNVDKQFKAQVHSIRAWDAAVSHQRREEPVNRIQNIFPIFNRPDLQGFAERYKSVLNMQKSISEYEAKTEASRLKEEHGIKLGFFEKRRLRRADRKIERMNRQLETMNAQFKESAEVESQRGDADARAFYQDMRDIMNRNQADYEQEQNWSDRGDPTHSILKNLGYETPEMKENREAKEQYRFDRYGMPEAPENEEAVKYDDENLVMDMIDDRMASSSSVRQMKSSEIGIKKPAAETEQKSAAAAVAPTVDKQKGKTEKEDLSLG